MNEAQELRAAIDKALKEFPNTQSGDLAKALIWNALDNVDETVPHAGKEAEELRKGIELVMTEDARDVGDIFAALQLLLDTVDARDCLAFLERNTLRPMVDAPKTATWVLAWTKDQYGNKQWLPVHWAEGGGEEQPPFRGWFYRFADGHSQIAESRLLGWVPLPREPKR